MGTPAANPAATHPESTRKHRSICLALTQATGSASAQQEHKPSEPPAPAAPAAAPLDWISQEAPLLAHHVQLTTRDQFVKAGESYFSPDGNWIIFQAVPVPPPGREPD